MVAMQECIFCKIASGEIPAKVVYTDRDVVAFEDINREAPVHVIVIPRKHIPGADKVDEGDAGLLGKLVYVASKIAKDKKIEASGYRLVMNSGKDAGQAVLHIHLHLLGGRKFSWPPG